MAEIYDNSIFNDQENGLNPEKKKPKKKLNPFLLVLLWPFSVAKKAIGFFFLACLINTAFIYFIFVPAKIMDSFMQAVMSGSPLALFKNIHIKIILFLSIGTCVYSMIFIYKYFF